MDIMNVIIPFVIGAVIGAIVGIFIILYRERKELRKVWKTNI